MRTSVSLSVAGSAGRQEFSPEQRKEMVAVAAYYRAGHGPRASLGGAGSFADWLEAEAEIDRMLGRAAEGNAGPDSKASFLHWLEAQLAELDGTLGELRMQALEMRSGSGFLKRLEHLAEKRALARERALQLRLHTDDAWDDMRGGTEELLAEMREEIFRIAPRF